MIVDKDDEQKATEEAVMEEIHLLHWVEHDVESNTAKHEGGRQEREQQVPLAGLQVQHHIQDHYQKGKGKKLHVTEP